MEVGWGGAGRAAERARGAWGTVGEQRCPGVGQCGGGEKGATVSVLEMSPGVAALKGGWAGSLNQPQCLAVFPWEPQSLHPHPPGVLRAKSPLQVGSQRSVRSRPEQLCPKSCRGQQGPPGSSREHGACAIPTYVRWGHRGPERQSCHPVRIQHQTQNGSRSPARTCCHLSGRVTARPAASETPLSWTQDLWTCHLTGQRGLCRRD